MHQIYQFLHNRKSKPCSFSLALGRSSLSFKCLKRMFLKFFSHTDSGILYREFVFGKSRCDHSLDAAKCDRSSRWGKFNCIIQYIYQYLLQFCRITPYQWILYLILNFEINHSLLDAVFEHHFQIFFHLLQVSYHLHNFCLSTFDFRQIQHIIDDLQKNLTRCLNFGNCIFYNFFIIRMFCNDIRKSNDRIHRGTDIMGHICKESILYLTGYFRFPCRFFFQFQCFGQSFPVFKLHLILLVLHHEQVGEQCSDYQAVRLERICPIKWNDIGICQNSDQWDC